MFDVEDTIVAIASPTTPAIRGIVRLSGNGIGEILETLCRDPSDSINPSTARSARRFDTTIDVGSPLGMIPVHVMFWPTSRSYTGQPAAELHTDGSLPLLQSIVRATVTAGARPAKPGEFTMRAFLAGRLDLTQAEAVLGVIEAEGRGSLDHALSQLAGNLSKPLESMRSELLDLLADVDAGLDFVDEDIEFISDQTLIHRLRGIAEQLQTTAETLTTRSGGAARTTIVLAGRANAGKSSLMNLLAQQEAAIVADVAGTTRDVVSVDADLAGYPVRLVDTAGIQQLDSVVAKLAEHQADRATEAAEIRLWCCDISGQDFRDRLAELRQRCQQLSRSATDLFVATKADLCVDDQVDRRPGDQWIATSARSGWGIDTLIAAMVDVLSGTDAQETGCVQSTAARCQDSLSCAQTSVQSAIDLTRDQQGHELVASELRSAVNCLGEVTGAVYTDDILDRVFGRFCIGK